MIPGSRSKLLFSSLLILGLLVAGWVAFRGVPKKESSLQPVAETVVVEEVEVTEVRTARDEPLLRRGRPSVRGF